MLRVTTWLATKVQQWTTECDNHLFRAISYLNETKDHLLTGHVGDDLHDIYVELFCDADFCGDDEHTYSTTGGWVQLSGKHTSFPLTWMSKKQGAVSRSTTEAEAAAMATTLFDEGLPLLELFSVLFKKSVRLLIREDNEATAKVVSAGPALDLLGIVNGYVVTRTTNTGLKMQENFDESLQPSYADAKPVSVSTQDNPKPM